MGSSARSPAIKFSPRAWGWSAPQSGVPSGLCVLPTRSCGDGPPRGQIYLYAGHVVLPTRVGMVRTTSTRSCRRGCSPHARGDGPPSSSAEVGVIAFSPRAWGWSASGAYPSLRPSVLPTPSGMRSVAGIDVALLEQVLPTRVGMVRHRTVPIVIGAEVRPGTSAGRSGETRLGNVVG